MANDISNLPNSFVQFRTAARSSTCLEYDGVRLPLYRTSDVECMVRINDTTTVYLDTISFYGIKGDYNVGDVVAAGDILWGTGRAYALISGDDYILFMPGEVQASCTSSTLGPGGGLVNTADPGECVRLVICVDSTKVIVAIADPVFYYEPDTCWTKRISYRCPDNSFGFFYEEADAKLILSNASYRYYNRIRLPITLQNPTPQTARTGFRKSDGSFLTLASTKDKQWEVDTDYFDDHTHTCLDAAIDHDLVYITDDQVVGCDYSDYEFHHPEGDNYTIDWQDQPGNHLGVAKASFKLKTTPYYSENNNC